jgi:hypothetical protein
MSKFLVFTIISLAAAYVLYIIYKQIKYGKCAGCSHKKCCADKNYRKCTSEKQKKNN